MIGQLESTEPLQRYFDYLVQNPVALTAQYFNLNDMDETLQYSAEELDLEVV